MHVMTIAADEIGSVILEIKSGEIMIHGLYREHQGIDRHIWSHD
ncbi:hypothetical protein P245_12315 [Comamonas thiooxydans]|uniref:Uncharacterized protein n=1 Tax=Comamonas thiooxydans TaxID=363952 RepID=A0A0E3BG08_9BURK|nr:hypothetical protein P245_12315 [Comamonas thiooxydans]